MSNHSSHVFVIYAKQRVKVRACRDTLATVSLFTPLRSGAAPTLSHSPAQQRLHSTGRHGLQSRDRSSAMRTADADRSLSPSLIFVISWI